MKQRGLRAAFWVEAVLSACGGVLAILTLVRREWIETLFRIDPDQGSGSLEWIVVVALLVIAVGAGARAGREWRQARAVTA